MQQHELPPSEMTRHVRQSRSMQAPRGAGGLSWLYLQRVLGFHASVEIGS